MLYRKYMKSIIVVKRQIVRGHHFVTIPHELVEGIDGDYMKVSLQGKRLVYEPINEGG
jgi:hypothetical protein